MALLPYHIDDDILEAGCDEAGRGCLAGPVVAAAVILPRDFSHPLLNDSKQLTPKQRKSLLPIIEAESLAYAVTKIHPTTIDQINILNASFKAMHHSIKKLSLTPGRLLIDGNRFKPYSDLEHHCIIKGDGKYASIAAASVLAKEYRDAYMKKIALKHPCYCWEKNKGYPTQEHRAAILKHGPCSYHRRSFRLYPYAPQGKLFP